MDQLNSTLDLYLVKKAPGIPARWQEVLVKYLPWITLIFLVLSLPAVLALFGISALVAPLAVAGGYGGSYTIAVIFLAVSLVLEGLAIPGLFKRSIQGWNMLFYSALVGAIYSLLTMNIFSLIVGTLLWLYILFQIKSHYK